MLERAASSASAAEETGSRCRLLTLAPNLPPPLQKATRHAARTLTPVWKLEITGKCLKIEGRVVTLRIGCHSPKIMARIGKQKRIKLTQKIPPKPKTKTE